MNWWSSKQQLSKIWCSENKKKDLKRKKKIHVFTGKQDVNRESNISYANKIPINLP